MASGVSFLVPENDLLSKLKLNAKPELEDADVLERCPNNRYIRVRSIFNAYCSIRAKLFMMLEYKCFHRYLFICFVEANVRLGSSQNISCYSLEFNRIFLSILCYKR